MRKASIFFVLTMVLCANAVQAASLKNKEFLKLSDGQKHWWHYGVFMSIGHVVSFKDEKKAQCVWLWMTKNQNKKKKLLDTNYKKFPNHTPTSIVFALLKRDCGVVFLKEEKSAT